MKYSINQNNNSGKELHPEKNGLSPKEFEFSLTYPNEGEIYEKEKKISLEPFSKEEGNKNSNIILGKKRSEPNEYENFPSQISKDENDWNELEDYYKFNSSEDNLFGDDTQKHNHSINMNCHKKMNLKTLIPTETHEQMFMSSKNYQFEDPNFLELEGIATSLHSNIISLDEDDEEEEEKKRYFVPNSKNNTINIVPFNSDYYKKNTKEFQYVLDPTSIRFISMEQILRDHEKELSKLWEGDGKIFDGKKDFDDVAKKSKIIENISFYLTGQKTYKDKRMFDSDQMTKKIKGKVLVSFIKAISCFKEFEMKTIVKLCKKSINLSDIGEFNLILLSKSLYQILSNKEWFKEKIEKIMKNGENLPINHILEYTFQNCLDIFRYATTNEENKDKFEYKLVNFLKEEYETQKKKKKK